MHITRRRFLLSSLALAACARAGGSTDAAAPQPWEPVDRKFKGCEGG